MQSCGEGAGKGAFDSLTDIVERCACWLNCSSLNGDRLRSALSRLAGLRQIARRALAIESFTTTAHGIASDHPFGMREPAPIGAGGLMPGTPSFA